MQWIDAGRLALTVLDGRRRVAGLIYGRVTRAEERD
jgi:hypothetical protein